MRGTLLLLVAALVLLVAVSLVSAQSRDFDIGWHTIDGGGATSLGGDRFTLSGTIGQVDTKSLAAGVLRLQGGFWGLVTPDKWLIYLPLIQR